ncbi:MAG: hypothetical protein A2173_12025 [Planctomycetes bacterium RBG_13_44_8b]|nr:MAG: hypothetical protein A2173_12025 [Planctomycetes bacterium RBG_13_44_8b]
MTIKIKIINDSNSACHDFVNGCSESKICYLPAWAESILPFMGHKSYYLAATNQDDIVHGVLPLTYVNSRLFGKRMVSQGFSNYGGLLTDSDQARDALFRRAVELATKLQCKSIEFRNIKPLPYDLRSRTDKISMHLHLASDPDQLWNSFLPKVRNQVRKAEKSGITVSEGGVELLEDFYRVYTIRMRQLGTPGYPRLLMYNILKQFKDNSRIFLVRLGNLTVGAAFTMCYNGFAEIPWAATLTEYNNLCPNNLLYWSIIKHYCLAGAKCFDFGRCTVNGPTYQFKKQWGAEPIELHYQYWVHPSHELSIASQNSPKYQKKVQIWKKLPLWVTRLIGPYISRQLP